MELEWSDKRPLEDIAFGGAASETERVAVAARVREILTKCDVKTGDDIAALGCTGLAAHGFDIDDGKFVRVGMAGSGIGLTCFVPLARFCLVHETPGGLQESQAAQFEDQIPKISRELTKEERYKIGLVETVRHRNPNADLKDRLGDASDILSGRKAPDEEIDIGGPEAAEADYGEPLLDTPRSTPASGPTPPPGPMRLPGAFVLLCDEHEETLLNCRLCVAEAIANGALLPKFLLIWADGNEVEEIVQARLDDRLAVLDKAGIDSAGLYVRVARYSRRLAKE
jgi:hypothetical protein